MGKKEKEKKGKSSLWKNWKILALARRIPRNTAPREGELVERQVK